MFDQILVPVDGSLLAENVIPHTIAMAQAYDSEVTLISVLDPLGGNISTRPIDPWDWRIQRAEVETYLKELSLPFQAAGLTVHTSLLEGKAPDHVINYSSRKGANLIILSSHGQGGISGWNTSSVVTKITQQARISVMIIRSYLPPEQKPENLHYRRILVPLDGSQRAEFGLFAAAHLARAHEAGLLIAHVIKPPELPRRTPLSVQDFKLSELVIESNRAEASHYLDALKATLDCKVDTCLLVGDSVAEALHTLVEQEEIDLIILNAHGFGGNPRWHFGNVAVNFLAYSTIPLLVVQDFNRDNLVEGQAETYSNDFQSQAPVVLNEAQNRY
ncbi:MAG: universal stress protein [Omnitrophica WOR_2 bacterium]